MNDYEEFLSKWIETHHPAILRKMACNFANHAIARMTNSGAEPDHRLRLAIEESERFAAGEATEAELAAARTIAEEAAWETNMFADVFWAAANTTAADPKVAFRFAAEYAVEAAGSIVSSHTFAIADRSAGAVYLQAKRTAALALATEKAWQLKQLNCVITEGEEDDVMAGKPRNRRGSGCVGTNAAIRKRSRSVVGNAFVPGRRNQRVEGRRKKGVRQSGFNVRKKGRL